VLKAAAENPMIANVSVPRKGNTICAHPIYLFNRVGSLTFKNRNTLKSLLSMAFCEKKETEIFTFLPTLITNVLRNTG
jgi:hypothetical protein